MTIWAPERVVSKPKAREPVAWGIPMMATVFSDWAIGALRMPKVPGDLLLPSVNTLIADSREGIAAKFLASKLKWLFFLDSDVILLETDTIDRLLAHNRHIVGGVYVQKGGACLPNMLKYKEFNIETGVHDYENITEFKIGDLVEVDGLGAGCLLIHREVFEKMPRPWFHFKEGGEDLAFCRQAQALGYKIWADTSIELAHMNPVGFTMKNFLAHRIGIKQKDAIDEAMNSVMENMARRNADGAYKV